MQAPPLHTSPKVQALPSLHETLLLAWTHPRFGSQRSSVQGFPSLHDGAVPPAHTPPRHVVPPHAPPHAVPSAAAGCVHVPPLQTSRVQGLPSSGHAAVLATNWQPATGSHESVVHGL